MQKLGPQAAPRRGRLAVAARGSLLRATTPRLVFAALMLVGGAAGCGSSDDSSTASLPSASVTTTTATPAPTSSSTPTATSTRTDPLAASPVRPVVRDGKTPKPSIGVKPTKFRSAARFEDGLTLEVTDIAQATSQGQGPGVFAGEPVTRFTLTVTNKSDEAVDLNQVILQVRYGDPQRVASPVYDETSRELHGELKPGKQAKATYGFSIPTSALSDVLMTVDLDGIHAIAHFTGSVK